MEFTRKFNELKAQFSLNKDIIPISGSSIEIRNLNFKSKTSLSFPFEDEYDSYDPEQLIIFNDKNIAENKSFRYPIFLPQSKSKHDKAIILLHGLNEKSWLKYLPWAYYLVEQTNRPVILFPISFHMNRCPEAWANPRAMISLLSQRQNKYKPDSATFVNVALSERLTEDPLRFLRAGIQSSGDIVDLMEQIKTDKHLFIKADAQIDFFAYSIGSFLSQVLFIANPKNLFNSSKLFLFCGGALFSQMHGTSKLIMDSQAFVRLRKYYLEEFVSEINGVSPFSLYVNNSPIGSAFKAMLAPEFLKEFRKSIFHQFNERVKVVALAKDFVIPADCIKSTFSSIKDELNKIVEVLDFPYDYSHEIPFPVLNNPNYKQVDRSFESVFSSAASFLR